MRLINLGVVSHNEFSFFDETLLFLNLFSSSCGILPQVHGGASLLLNFWPPM